MTKLLEKIFWTVYNHLYVVMSSSKAPGLLPDKKDVRDIIWKSVGKYERKHESHDIATDYAVKDWRFYQFPFNICTAASMVMAMSWQNGMRFSVRWTMKLMRREGYVSGNGFSFTRAPFKVSLKYGLLPYEEMPDETTGLSWNEYSRWTEEDEKLLSVAKKYRITEYARIVSEPQAYMALDLGYVLCTASKWYETMNRPKPPKYMMLRGGRLIGGHAYPDTGYNENLFILTNSFGKWWGNEWQAHDPGLFEAHDYATWIAEKMSMSQRMTYLIDYHRNSAIKGSGKNIYLFKDNGKKKFSNWEEYLEWCDDNGKTSNSYLLIRDDLLEEIPTVTK